ncbi:uncharacterized protein LOC134199323 [Bombyx mori]|uniref:uncharacterized protein LOC134199323 n=1 Tax=Bombyx mori TaxID=7091 RepID=UPI002ED1319A
MEVIEDGNIIDRIPILLQRDLEYYQKNQTVLSETICRSVVGGRLDFPRNASFAAVKIVLWLEEEFSIAFKQGSGMFVNTEEEEEKLEGGVAKTSDPDKFVQLTVKSSDALLGNGPGREMRTEMTLNTSKQFSLNLQIDFDAIQKKVLIKRTLMLRIK